MEINITFGTNISQPYQLIPLMTNRFILSMPDVSRGDFDPNNSESQIETAIRSI